MSSIFRIYHLGLISAVVGAGLVVYGVVGNAHLVLLGGAALIVLGIYRFGGRASR